MKSLKKLIVVLTIAFSFNAMAALKVDSVTLNDNSNLDVSSISQLHLNSDQSVDFIDLKDGSRVEGAEVKNISLSAKFQSRIQARAAVRTGGDGSGG